MIYVLPLHYLQLLLTYPLASSPRNLLHNYNYKNSSKILTLLYNAYFLIVNTRFPLLFSSNSPLIFGDSPCHHSLCPPPNASRTVSSTSISFVSLWNSWIF